MERSQPGVVLSVRIGSGSEEQLDGDGVALIRRPGEGRVPLRVGGFERDGLEGVEEVGEEKGGGGVNG